MPVNLGQRTDAGIAPMLQMLLERGAEREPELAASLRGLVELRFETDGLDPVRVRFSGYEVLVEDGTAEQPDLVIGGTLPDIVRLTAAPLTGGGFPNPVHPEGRAAIGHVVRRRVRIDGDRGLGRALLRLLQG